MVGLLVYGKMATVWLPVQQACCQACSVESNTPSLLCSVESVPRAPPDACDVRDSRPPRQNSWKSTKRSQARRRSHLPRPQSIPQGRWLPLLQRPHNVRQLAQAAHKHLHAACLRACMFACPLALTTALSLSLHLSVHPSFSPLPSSLYEDAKEQRAANSDPSQSQVHRYCACDHARKSILKERTCICVQISASECFSTSITSGERSNRRDASVCMNSFFLVTGKQRTGLDPSPGRLSYLRTAGTTLRARLN